MAWRCRRSAQRLGSAGLVRGGQPGWVGMLGQPGRPDQLWLAQPGQASPAWPASGLVRPVRPSRGKKLKQTLEKKL